MIRRPCFRTQIAVAAVALVAGCGQPPEPPPDLPYNREYPGIAYAESRPGGRLGQFAQAVADGGVPLEPDPVRGYLDSVLGELDIDPSSQVLVYSRTSQQTRFIGPDTPRAIYFNDDTYVAWTPRAPTLEMTGFDPALGPVFYTMLQDAVPANAPERRFSACLRCHDTYSLSGGGVPRFLLGSGYTGTDGELVSHEAWILTSQATPLRSRWGGWYVTGQHGANEHLGNIVVERAEDLQDLEALRVGNVDTLDELFDASQYLQPTSDIVALMVLEHQVDVQNLISRLRFEAVAGNPVDRHVETLADAMLMRDAITLTDPVSANSGFAEYFESLGPFDATGRSLRAFDLQTRLFRYPLSYLIYSEAFQNLPESTKQSVYRRLRDGLGITSAGAGERQAVSQILSATLPAALAD